LGQDGVPFKFAQLRIKATDEELSSQGRALAWSGLDRLPALWNVLRGEMSLVGPHPLYEAQIAAIIRARPLPARREIAHQLFHRLAVKPGIVGFTQVEALGRKSMNYACHRILELDAAYSRGLALWKYQWILGTAADHWITFLIWNALDSLVGAKRMPPVALPTFNVQQRLERDQLPPDILESGPAAA
jgi:lipopolysaccharide/colanic/teichoic acid biosynthesis glycosyltransferase